MAETAPALSLVPDPPPDYGDAFADAVAIVLEHEGVLSDDARDPGGLTKYGISKRAYPDLDVAALTREAAIAIYHRDYWTPIRGDDLPWALALPAFDCAVNQGVGTAARVLQKTLDVPRDGAVGPVTLAALRRADPKSVLFRFQAERALRYAANGNFAAYGRGWNHRLHRITIEACLG